MCIKSSCTNCHSKSHCQEKSLRDEIEEYKKLTEKLIKELEDSNKCLELAGEKIEKMKKCQNCRYFDFYCKHPNNPASLNNKCNLWEIK